MPDLPKTATPDVAPQSPLSWLPMVQNGEIIDQVADAMAELIEAVRNTGKAGSLTLKVGVKPATRNKRTDELIQVEILGEVTARLPKDAPVAQTLYLDDAGRLSLRNPMQPDLPQPVGAPVATSTTAAMPAAANQ